MRMGRLEKSRMLTGASKLVEIVAITGWRLRFLAEPAKLHVNLCHGKTPGNGLRRSLGPALDDIATFNLRDHFFRPALPKHRHIDLSGAHRARFPIDRTDPFTVHQDVLAITLSMNDRQLALQH